MLAVAWIYALMGQPNRDSHYGVGRLDDGRWAFAWGAYIWARGLPDVHRLDAAEGYELHARESGALAAMRREVEARGDELAAEIVRHWELEAAGREMPRKGTARDLIGAPRAARATPRHAHRAAERTH